MGKRLTDVLQPNQVRGHQNLQKEESDNRLLYHPWSTASYRQVRKYLRVILTDNLSWNVHVDQATKKANNSLAFLRRNLYSCPIYTKVQSYQTLGRPILEYASSAWDPYTHQNIDKLETVKRHAARFVTGDYRTPSSVSDMISNMGWETLQQRRTQAKLVMVYRITYGLIDISATTLLHQATLSTRGNSMRYLPPYCRTDIYRCSFFRPGYAFGTSCRIISSQRQPWRPSREGRPVTMRCNRGMFLPVF